MRGSEKRKREASPKEKANEKERDTSLGGKKKGAIFLKAETRQSVRESWEAMRGDEQGGRLRFKDNSQGKKKETLVADWIRV